jgi:hypothetical protein
VPPRRASRHREPLRSRDSHRIETALDARVSTYVQGTRFFDADAGCRGAAEIPCGSVVGSGPPRCRTHRSPVRPRCCRHPAIAAALSLLCRHGPSPTRTAACRAVERGRDEMAVAIG